MSLTKSRIEGRSLRKSGYLLTRLANSAALLQNAFGVFTRVTVILDFMLNFEFAERSFAKFAIHGGGRDSDGLVFLNFELLSGL